MNKSIKYITGLNDEVISHYVIDNSLNYEEIKRSIQSLYPMIREDTESIYVFIGDSWKSNNPKLMAQCLGEVPFNCLLLPEWLPYMIDYTKHNICEGCKGYFKKEEINDNGYCESCQYTYEQILDHRTGC